MFGQVDLANLIDLAGVHRMECGWQVVIRADWVDVTEQQPHGIDYAIILQDERGERLFGFDNAHAFDGAGFEDRWDHEHKPGRTGQRFRYDFGSASQLITDFFDRVKDYCATRGVPFEFVDEGHD